MLPDMPPWFLRFAGHPQNLASTPLSIRRGHNRSISFRESRLFIIPLALCTDIVLVVNPALKKEQVHDHRSLYSEIRRILMRYDRCHWGSGVFVLSPFCHPRSPPLGPYIYLDDPGSEFHLR